MALSSQNSLVFHLEGTVLVTGRALWELVLLVEAAEVFLTEGIDLPQPSSALEGYPWGSV